MENSNKNEKAAKINPAIKNKAIELFALIEEEKGKFSDFELVEAIAEEMPEVLKRWGASQLEWAFLIAKPYSERAMYNLEESTWYMRNEALETYHELAKNAKEAVDFLEEKPINVSALRHRLDDLKELAPKVLDKTQTEFRYRCMKYGKEIKDLRLGRVS